MKTLVRGVGFVSRYIIWIGIFALGLLIIQVLRGDLFSLLIHLRVSAWAIPAILNFSIVIAFVAWLAVVIWLEAYLTEPREMSVFWRRLGRVLIPMGVVLAVGHVIDLII